MSQNFSDRMAGFGGVRGVAFGSAPDSWVVLYSGGAAFGNDTPYSLKVELTKRNPSNIAFLSMGPMTNGLSAPRTVIGRQIMASCSCPVALARKLASFQGIASRRCSLAATVPGRSAM